MGHLPRAWDGAGRDPKDRPEAPRAFGPRALQQRLALVPASRPGLARGCVALLHRAPADRARAVTGARGAGLGREERALAARHPTRPGRRWVFVRPGPRRLPTRHVEEGESWRLAARCAGTVGSASIEAPELTLTQVLTA